MLCHQSGPDGLVVGFSLRVIQNNPRTGQQFGIGRGPRFKSGLGPIFFFAFFADFWNAVNIFSLSVLIKRQFKNLASQALLIMKASISNDVYRKAKFNGNYGRIQSVPSRSKLTSFLHTSSPTAIFPPYDALYILLA